MLAVRPRVTGSGGGQHGPPPHRAGAVAPACLHPTPRPLAVCLTGPMTSSLAPPPALNQKQAAPALSL